jgi:hypothetical protein
MGPLWRWRFGDPWPGGEHEDGSRNHPGDDMRDQARQDAGDESTASIARR